MSAPLVALVDYFGDLLTDQMTTVPWKCVGIQFPDGGGVPYKPQFNLDVLEPANVDGARYRIGGAHFPRFRVRTVVACSSFAVAKTVAREHELCKGEPISLTPYNYELAIGEDTTFQCAVIDVRAVANATRILGAAGVVSGPGGVPGGGATTDSALAAVDTEWVLQVFLP